MKKVTFIVIVLFSLLLSVNAQNDINAFRFSQTNWGGTARFMGAGGAFGAVGADYSALSINPASIGLYKRSEVTFTPLVLSIHKSQSDYNGTNTHFLSNTYALTNFGAVITTKTKEESKWKRGQFAVGYNRINDFNNQFRIEGMSGGSTMADQFVNQANGTNFDELTEGDLLLAWDSWLIDTIPGNSSQYYSPFSGKDVEQKKFTKIRGGIDEMNFSGGFNYDDQIYFGATIGIPVLKYREESIYQETDVDNVIGGIDSYQVTDILKVNGVGVNLKLGMIYQPVNFFRVGVAFHTPTYYGKLKNRFTRTLETNYDDGELAFGEYENHFNYKLITPLRVVGSVAFILQRRAIVSADYEVTNYGLATMYASDYSFSEENQNIQKKYGVTHSVRIGGELFVTNQFLCRLGYNFTSNPYKDKINHSPMHTGTIGIGLRTQYLFVDVAYAIQFSKEDYWLYEPTYVNFTQNQYTRHKIAATIGVKF